MRIFCHNLHTGSELLVSRTRSIYFDHFLFRICSTFSGSLLRFQQVRNLKNIFFKHLTMDVTITIARDSIFYSYRYHNVRNKYWKIKTLLGKYLNRKGFKTWNMQSHLLVKFDGIFGLVLLATRLFVAFEKDSAMLKISENIVPTNMFNFH